MPRGGSRDGAGRKPFPEFKPEGIVIDVRNATAYVSRWQRQGTAFSLVPAHNWQGLQDKAEQEIGDLGGSITMSGIYPCSPSLSAQGIFENNRRVLVESVAVKLADGILDEADVRRINDSDEGWTYEVGGDQHWTRYEGARLTEAELAEALRLAAEWDADDSRE